MPMPQAVYNAGVQHIPFSMIISTGGQFSQVSNSRTWNGWHQHAHHIEMTNSLSQLNACEQTS